VTVITATPHEKKARSALARGELGIALYHGGSVDLPGVGHVLPAAFERLPQAPSQLCWDLLSISLAVFAADRFVLRNETPDGWTRTLDLRVAVSDPATWIRTAREFDSALRFLTGDFWKVSFQDDGSKPPIVQERKTDRDCACLFSGGLDSLVGAVDLVTAGRSPLLVSQASPKEGPYQTDLAAQFDMTQHRFEGRAIERFKPPYEPSTRARSILFFAYGVLCASTLSSKKVVDLVVPENGFISLNPPLTMRRIGSLSTRTTHPYFTGALQRVLDSLGMSVRMIFPYRFKTKGEMLQECEDARLRSFAHRSYSCGKGKRLNQQCGRCVPCLVRRAAFRKAGWPDRTDYFVKDLAQSAGNDDVSAMRIACAKHSREADWLAWARQSGPLPGPAREQRAFAAVLKRGTDELAALLEKVHSA
jgi:7-cyano-7-deazaguanine synthase in queuosine biosynthesis